MTSRAEHISDALVLRFSDFVFYHYIELGSLARLNDSSNVIALTIAFLFTSSLMIYDLWSKGVDGCEIMVDSGHDEVGGADAGVDLSGISPRGTGRKLARLQPVVVLNRNWLNWPSEFKISILETRERAAQCGRPLKKHP